MGAKTKMPKTGLKEGEVLIRSAGGGAVSFFGTQGGYLYLTDKRVLHESGFGKITKEILLDEIAATALASAGFLLPVGILGFFMKCVVINEKNGLKTKYYCKDAKGMIAAIYEAKKA